MKYSVLVLKSIFIMLLFALVGCDRESEDDKIQIQNEINIITEKLHQTFFEFEILGGEESEVFRVENSGMNGFYGLTRDATDNLDDNDQNLFDCIQEVDANLFQLYNLKGATDSFSVCRGAISPAYIGEIDQIVLEKEQERIAVYAKFYQNELTLEEVIAQVAILKAEIKAEVEKIKDAYESDFKICTRQYMSGIQNSLNSSQWNTFKNCM